MKFKVGDWVCVEWSKWKGLENEPVQNKKDELGKISDEFENLRIEEENYINVKLLRNGKIMLLHAPEIIIRRATKEEKEQFEEREVEGNL